MSDETNPDELESKIEFVESVYGRLAIPANPRDLIGRYLSAYGEWGYCEPLLLSPLLGNDATVFDTGAFIGTFALGIAAQGAKRVVSIEANPKTIGLLQTNLTNLCKAEHHIVHAAVGETVGRARQVTMDDENLGATTWLRIEPDAGPVDEPTIDFTTLAALRERYGDYQLLKLDVEGAEKKAVMGDKDWLEEAKPIIWAECNQSASSVALLEVLLSLGYAAMYVAYPSFRQTAFRKPEEDIFPLAYEAALLAAPSNVLANFQPNVVGEELLFGPVRDGGELRQMLWRTPRWALSAWVQMSRLELLALLGRHYRGELFADFLREPE